MTFHALVVDDSPDVLDDVKDRLESLGHTCDCANSVQAARDLLTKNEYSYALIDLEIPVRYSKPSRIQNGHNLVREIAAMKGFENLPIIVMTSHGHDSPDLAVEVMRGRSAVDYVKKPFPVNGHTLEQAVREALDSSGRTRPGAARRSGIKTNKAPQPFESGEMVFYEHRVELCGVQICGGNESGLSRRILDELRQKNSRGNHLAYSGAELAERIGCPAGQNGVAGAVRALRKRIADVMMTEANVQCSSRDVIESGGRGYRLTEKIVVRESNDPDHDPVSDGNDPVTVSNDPIDDPVYSDLNERQRWALNRMRENMPVRIGDVVEQFACSTSTVKRDLKQLRVRGLIKFTGSPRTGCWSMCR